eukprot:TRINITY_DN20560_c0_g1_i4.p1 TRINITY_DN20560_c0_g1~~TRINITY_DN20560_c0_g1_i4.p1  ORF type:complete len:530 (-),score=28.01 TRINITY_DN20560_c0_g1_i4:254-1726(-)
MEAVKRCHAVSCRLGYRMRRCTVASLRMELRTAQKAVDDTRQVIQSATHLAADWQQRRQTDCLLAALVQHAASPCLSTVHFWDETGIPSSTRGVGACEAAPVDGTTSLAVACDAQLHTRSKVLDDETGIPSSTWGVGAFEAAPVDGIASLTAACDAQLHTRSKTFGDETEIPSSTWGEGKEQLNDLLGALAYDTPAVPLSATGTRQLRDTGMQTDHFLRCQVHALSCSKSTENPKHDLAEPFELRLSVAGPELDNSVGLIACNDPSLRAKITVKDTNLCFGEAHWTTKQLYTGPSVDCKLSTDEVLAMSKRIVNARSAHSPAPDKDWDDAGSEASTEAASSLGGPSSSATELSGCENDHFGREPASQEVLSRRRLAKARRSPGTATLRGRNNDATDARTAASGSSPKGVAISATLFGSGNLPTVQEEERDPRTEDKDRDQRTADFQATHALLQNTPLKIYCFKHTELYMQALELERFLERRRSGCDDTAA